MNLNFWDVLLATGILQGIIAGTIILFKKGENHIASITLALILFVCVLACTALLMGMMPPSEAIQSMERYIPFYLTFLIGPLLYFHVKSIVNANFKFSRKDGWHFLPVILNLIPSLLNMGQWMTSQMDKGYFQPDQLRSILHFHYIYSEAPAWLHITIYLILSKKYLQQYSNSKRRHSKTYFSWLKHFLKFFLIFQAIWFPFMVVNLTSYRNILYEYALLLYLLYIPLVAFIYWMGVKYLIDISSSLPARKHSIQYKDTEMKRLASLLNELMRNEKPYLDPQLNLTTLAGRVNANPKKVSHLFSQYLSTNFNDYVNEKRVQEVKSKLADPKYDHLTIAAIAFESGFSSIPTFQRAFKAFENISPKEFQQKHKKSVQI